MSNLSELLPSGGGQNVVEFTADGSISSGAAVALTSAGKAKAISASANPQVVGSTTAFDTNQTDQVAITYDSTNQKVVVVYRDTSNSNYPTAVVGTVSGDTISFGTAVVIESIWSYYSAATFDSGSGKVVASYKTNAFGQGAAAVGTVSGTSISFGSPVVYNSGANTEYINLTYDSANERIVIAFQDYANSSYGTAIVGTVSGTSISFGSEVVFNSGNTQDISITYDTASEKVVICYRDTGGSSYGRAIVGTVSGTSISFGSEVAFESAITTNCGITYDSANQKVVIGYQDFGNSSYGTAIVGTVSGTSISFGSPTVFEAATTSQISLAYDSNTESIVCGYKDGGNSNYGTFAVGKVSGTSISFTTPTVFEAGDIGSSLDYSRVWTTYDSANQRVVAAYVEPNDGSAQPFDGLAFTIRPVGSNKSDFIGLASAAISDTASGDINVKGGINEAQSSLTIGSDYYVQDDGSLSTTTSSVKVGQAISATTINMMDLT